MRRGLVVGAAGYAVVLAGLVLAGGGATPRPAAGRTPVAPVVQPTSSSCQPCHAEIFAAWSRSDHGLANRAINSVDDGAALALAPAWSGKAAVKPEMILGHRPLWQPLIPAPGNRWQAHELAFDPARKEWFNVFGDEGRQPGEWGHWTGRGMNWNSMCAQCHMTGYRKNYDPASDSYASSWVEHGVGCRQCHGPMPDDHQDPPKGGTRPPGAPPTGPFFGDRTRMMQTCAPCHARNEPLTEDFQPGDNYHDHYRLTLPVEPGTFYADGQQRDEDFNWTSVLLSRMGHAGVTCLDCHDPHSNRTILPAADNALCLQCHAPPGRVLPTGTRAVPIDPLAHSHHPAGSAGNSCVGCHMPTTVYMQRAPRHDHGWLKPDPLLTKELGIPNACNRCHAEQTVEWAIAQAEAWYGARLDSRQRARARAVAAAQARQPDAAGALLALLADEDIPAWRATFLTLLASSPENPGPAAAVARASLAARDPLERSAAVHFLARAEDARDLLSPLLRDPVRLVRLEAAWALSPELPAASPGRAELEASLALALDQPAGRWRRGADLANRGRLGEAEAELRLAANWDPFSAGIRETLGQVLAAQERNAAAAREFARAAELQPADASLAFRAALAFAAAGQPADAEGALRLTLARDPGFPRARYNLGLLLAQANRLSEAADALRQAEALDPAAGEAAYALATVLLRTEDRAGARAAALRALQANPAHAAAAQLLRSLGDDRSR